MTGSALGAGCGYNATVIHGIRMHRIKGIGMASGTVAARSKGFACCQADQAAFIIMTAGAGIMHFGI